MATETYTKQDKIDILETRISKAQVEIQHLLTTMKEYGDEARTKACFHPEFIDWQLEELTKATQLLAKVLINEA